MSPQQGQPAPQEGRRLRQEDDHPLLDSDFDDAVDPQSLEGQRLIQQRQEAQGIQQLEEQEEDQEIIQRNQEPEENGYSSDDERSTISIEDAGYIFSDSDDDDRETMYNFPPISPPYNPLENEYNHDEAMNMILNPSSDEDSDMEEEDWKRME